ncbi:uncharacterized protein [Temnothorax nylanderi]|uniref:uncharacterized protein n=1 Tax=Temnothorax nylanderi TaxID=102681 RepID=UPI003A88FB6B
MNHISVPDLTLVSNDISSRYSWNTLDEPMGSDHFPIVTQFHFDNCVDESRNVPVDSNMNGVAAIADSTAGKYERWYESLIDSALQAGAKIMDSGEITVFDPSLGTRKSFPISYSKKKMRPPWWDEECTDAVYNRSKAFKEFKSSSTEENLLKYRRFSREFGAFKKSIFFNKPNPPTESRLLAIDRTIENLAPPWVFDSFEREVTAEASSSIFEEKFSLQELKTIIMSLKVKSSPGPDLISNRLLQILPESAVNNLLDIFNQIMEDGSFPEQWKFFEVALIPKPNKNEFRPISLASCVLKVLERLVKRRLEKFLELDYVFPNCQFGFQRGKSCEDCLALINVEIYKSFALRQMTGAIFLDIKGAYDNVNPQILFKMINELKIPVGYKKFLRNLIGPRNVNFYESGGFFGKRLIQSGLPQGSVLSPDLFKLYLKDILKFIPHNVKVIQFADDIAFLCSDSNLDTILSTLSNTFDGIREWLSDLGLSISFPKTQFTIFHRKRNIVIPDRLEVTNGFLPFMNVVKYLGMSMDFGLRWHNHINLLRTRTMCFANILRWLTGSSWGIDPLKALNFVNATIGAQLEWGAIWYISAANTYTSIVERLLCSAYKIALGLPRSTPNRVCWHFGGQRSLMRRIVYKCDKFLYKAIQLRNTKLINKLIYLHNISMRTAPRNIPFIVKRWPMVDPFRHSLYTWTFHPVFSYPNRFNMISTTFDIESGMLARDNGSPNQAFINLISFHRSSPEEVVIYTDGSRFESEEGICVGSSVWVPQAKILLKYKLNVLSSSFTAECLAISKAIDLMWSQSWNFINVCTDSLSAIQALGNENHDYKLSPLIPDLKMKLSLAACENRHIKFSWCPSHKGIQGNEVADRAAKEAAINGVFLDNRISFKDALSYNLRIYEDIDAQFLSNIDIGTGKYYMEKFSDVKLKTLKYRVTL